MAVLSNTIKLNDYMSPALRHICTAVNQTVSTLESLNNTMNTNINMASMQSARNEIAQATIYLDTYDNQVQETINNTNRLGYNSNSVFSRMANSLKNMVSMYAVMQGMKWLGGVSDEMAQVNAKLNMINDTGYGVVRLNQAIFKTANDSRAVYSDMASQIAKLRMNTGNLFNTSEAIQFSSILNKQFKIAGATVEETKNATTQLVQALGSGVLRGDELNSVFEAAPSILQAVADYMDVDIGKIRELASEGQITSQILKNALLDPQTVQKVNEDFSNIPLTFGDLWTRAINNVKMGLMETSNTLSSIANNSNMLEFIDNIQYMTQAFSTGLVMTFTTLATIANFAYENWSMLAPILGTVVGIIGYYKSVLALAKLETMLHARAQAFSNGITWASVQAKLAETGAQLGLNSALYACPLTWYAMAIMVVVGVFFLLIAVINKVTGANISAVGVIVGSWYGAGAIIQNIFFGICNVAMMTFAFIYNSCVAAVTGVQNGFISMENIALSVFESVANRAIDLGNAIQRGILWGVNKAIDGLNALSNFANNIPGINLPTLNHIGGGSMSHVSFGRKAHKTPNYVDVSSSLFNFKDVGAAYNKGYGIGANWKKYLFGIDENTNDTNKLINDLYGKDYSNGVGGSANPGIGGGSGSGSTLKDIANNTAAIYDEMKATGINVEYIRDLAEREVINRYTTAEIKVEMTNNNNISKDVDVDGVIRRMTTEITEAINTSAEGVHIA